RGCSRRPDTFALFPRCRRMSGGCPWLASHRARSAAQPTPTGGCDQDGNGGRARAVARLRIVHSNTLAIAPATCAANCSGEATMPAELPTATLGRTGLQVTRLGYGAMELRGSPRGPEVSDEDAD